MPTKLAVKTRKPRNPLCTAARMRRAGAHRRCGGAQRQHAKALLRLALAPLPHRQP